MMNRKDVALAAMTEASLFLKGKFGAVRSGKEKSDGTLASEADHGSDDIIVRAIQQSFPEDGILSEEREEIAGKSGYRWIIDPLDGTHNFLSGIPLFASLLALEYEGKTVLGVCDFPKLEERFVAEIGKGAFCNGERIRVSDKKTLKGNLLLVDGKTTLVAETIATGLKKLSGTDRFRFLGNAAFTMTRVSLGTVAAAYVREGNPWDYAAPVLIAEEAGGKVTDRHGNPWNGDIETLVFSNGVVHQELLAMLG